MLEIIYATYSLIDKWFDQESLRSQYEDSRPWPRMRELNGYAYFVLLFAEFEDLINVQYRDKSGQIFERKRTHIAARQSDYVRFEDKVYSVFSREEDFELVGLYYECAMRLHTAVT